MRHFLPKDTVLVNEAERLYPSCNDFNEFLSEIQVPGKRAGNVKSRKTEHLTGRIYEPITKQNNETGK